MRKDFSLHLEYQKSLIYCALEDASASELLPGVEGGRYGSNPNAWKISVADFLSKAIQKKWLLVKDGLGYFSSSPVAEDVVHIYCNAELSDKLLWMGVQFVATEKLIDQLKRENLLSWEALHSYLNENLAIELES